MGKARRTADIENFFVRVSRTKRQTSDVIRDTFIEIRQAPDLHQLYVGLVARHGVDVVHQWGAKWIARDLGWRTGPAVDAPANELIRKYSKLVDPGVKDTCP